MNERSLNNDYVRVLCHDHPKANRDGYVYEHTLVAEKALGRYLPDGVEIHHFNERKADNRGSNLVICPSHKYHLLLHVRMDALMASGNPDWRKCPYCKQYDDTSNMSLHKSKVSDGYFYHLKCCNAYRVGKGLTLRKNRRS
jgi:hypothetical protein